MLEPDNDSVDTASSSDGFEDHGDLACRRIYQEPWSLYIGNFWAARSCVQRTAAELLEEASGMHNTVTLETDVYTGHGPTANDKFDRMNREIVNDAVARFILQARPRMPSLADAIGVFVTMCVMQQHFYSISNPSNSHHPRP